MRNETSVLAARLKETLDAFKRGDLAQHAMSKSAMSTNGKVASSWGPANRR